MDPLKSDRAMAHKRAAESDGDCGAAMRPDDCALPADPATGDAPPHEQNVVESRKKRARRSKRQTEEEAAAMQFKKRVETAAREQDGTAALAAYEEMKQANLPVTPYICRVTINACAVAPQAGEFKDAAMKVFHEWKDAFPQAKCDETVYSALIKICSKAKQYDVCRELLASMQSNKVEPRLRTFSPLLRAYADEGDLAQALWVHERLRDHALELTEIEFVALLRACMTAGDSEQFYRVLDEYFDTILQPGPAGGEMLKQWFASAAAQVNGHKWVCADTTIDSQGVCSVCQAQLQSLELSAHDHQELLDKIESLVRIDETRISQWDEFKQWLDAHGPFDVVIDAANVGFFNQNFDGGGFSYKQIAHMVAHYEAQHRKVLVVLHQRRTRDDHVPEPYRATLAAWRERHVMYNCCKGNNDDWYWLYAAVKLGGRTLVVTNDEMRDHHFQMIHNRAFGRWKERHQVHYAIHGAARLTVQEPASYSARPQHARQSAEAPPMWHVPVLDPVTHLPQWLCCSCDK